MIYCCLQLEKKSIFISFNRGRTFSEIRLSSPARNVAYYRVGRREFIVVSSDDSFYLSSDGIEFSRVRLNTRGLALRYPTLYLGRLLFSGVGVRSSLVAVDLRVGNTYIYDITNIAGDASACRLAVFNDVLFVGSELCGKLYAVNPNSLRMLQAKDFVRLYAGSLRNYVLRRLLGPFPKTSSVLQIL